MTKSKHPHSATVLNTTELHAFKWRKVNVASQSKAARKVRGRKTLKQDQGLIPALPFLAV